MQEVKDYFTKWWSKDWDWRKRNLQNIVDDPIDDVKHKLHGMKIPFTSKKIKLPKWLMRGSGDPTK